MAVRGGYTTIITLKPEAPHPGHGSVHDVQRRRLMQRCLAVSRSSASTTPSRHRRSSCNFIPPRSVGEARPCRQVVSSTFQICL